MLPDGELYTGTVADYRGNRPVISRHLSESRRVDLKLDDTLGWLEGKSPFFQRHMLNYALYIKSMLFTRSPNFDNKVSFIFYFQLLFFRNYKSWTFVLFLLYKCMKSAEMTPPGGPLLALGPYV